MKVIRMLTRGVINTVKAIDALTKQMASIDREREELIRSLKETIKSEDSYCNLEYLEVVSFDIVNEPAGNPQENGSYVLEKCDDSLFNPDSGSGIMFWPIENEDKWLKIEYLW
jgi:hypothetical protein